MSNIHILESSGPRKFRVVYHIPVPAGNNSAGTPWRTAVARSKINQASPSVLLDGDGTGGTISSAEKAQIQSGAIYEVVYDEKGQNATTIAATFARRSSEILSELQAELAQYGRTI
jgi:hypothetical protein